ncbi:hypothetical protein KY284_013156 [Solanum tuberosum]|nr:hypothetical protein KY284_013156 [Solanum tuberosum]
MASASHRQANTNNANPNTMLNHVVPSRQRSMKRGGGNSNHNASANGVFSQQQAHGFEVETVNNSGKSAQSHGGNDHQHQRNVNRRGNVGPHPRGDGTYHNGYGGRRDQERQNQDWKPYRGWGNKDAHMQPQRGPARPFMGAPPYTSPPYIPGPMHVQPYQPPMVYSGPFPDPLRMHMLSPVPPVFVHVPDTHNENLIKDTFLRQNMDEHGWVPDTLIAGFKKHPDILIQVIAENANGIFSSNRERQGGQTSATDGYPQDLVTA